MNVFHRITGKAIIPNTLKDKRTMNNWLLTYKRTMNNCLLTWKLSKKLGLTKQTFEALMNTNAAYTHLSYDLIEMAFIMY